MKNIVTVLLSAVVLINIGCKTAQNKYTEITQKVYEENLDGLFPLADSSYKYELKGMAGMELKDEIDAYASDIYPRLKNQASVFQFGQGVAIYLDRGNAFDFNNYQLNTYAKSVLKDVALALKEKPNTFVVVAGRTDAIGAQVYNKDLAYLRAAVAANYLSNRGIDKSRFLIDSYGEYFPHFTNYIVEGREKNRRVDLLIIPNNEMRYDASSR